MGANKITGRVLIVLGLITLNFVGWNYISEMLTQASSTANTIGWILLVGLLAIDIWGGTTIYQKWVK
jgi:hypothetical protein